MTEPGLKQSLPDSRAFSTLQQQCQKNDFCFSILQQCWENDFCSQGTCSIVTCWGEKKKKTVQVSSISKCQVCFPAHSHGFPLPLQFSGGGTTSSLNRWMGLELALCPDENYEKVSEEHCYSGAAIQFMLAVRANQASWCHTFSFSYLCPEMEFLFWHLGSIGEGYQYFNFGILRLLLLLSLKIQVLWTHLYWSYSCFYSKSWISIKIQTLSDGKMLNYQKVL